MIISQLVVNLLTMIQILTSCKKFSMLWNPFIKKDCWSVKVQADFGYFQGGEFVILAHVLSVPI